MRNKVLLIYNPYSGNGTFINNLDRIIERFQEQNLFVNPVRMSEKLDLNKLFKNLRQIEYRQIAVAGGDGTINICVNAMLKNNIKLPLAVFPTGTANDFARYFNLPVDIDGQIDIALGNKVAYSDVGICNDKYFINVAALGNIVSVSQRTDPNLKQLMGSLAYYLRGASEIVNLKPLHVKLITPRKTYKEKIYFMLVMNGSSAGGFRNLSPMSNINDGKLNVIVFKKMPIGQLAPTLFSVLNGSHFKSRYILSFETDELLIESSDEIDTDVDGEHGEKLPLNFKVLEKELRVFTPDGTEDLKY